MKNTVLNYVPSEAKLKSMKRTAPVQPVDSRDTAEFQLTANQAVGNSMASANPIAPQPAPLTSVDGFGRTI